MRGEPLVKGDGKSGATLERVFVNGEARIVKRVDYAHDWLMQAIGDTGGAPVRAWEAGLMDRLPPEIDHATISMENAPGAAGPQLTIVMHDMGEWLVPDDDAPVSLEQHMRFLDHMGAFHVAFWDWHDDVGLITLPDRYRLMTRDGIARAAPASPDSPVPALILQGWRALPDRAPTLADTLFALHDDPTPLIDALADTPSTFMHGDWKISNLGSRPDGRTILVDWSFPGAGPPCNELAHYLALNRSRMPQTKDAAIDTYRAALESRGIDTAPWWDRQLALALLGITVVLGWEKALGDADELAWWASRALEGAALL